MFAVRVVELDVLVSMYCSGNDPSPRHSNAGVCAEAAAGIAAAKPSASPNHNDSLMMAADKVRAAHSRGRRKGHAARPRFENDAVMKSIEATRRTRELARARCGPGG
jgi:hypothetical protein